MDRQFLFGRPVAPAKPVADGPRILFLLGAYPSALHVRWFGPERDLLVQAVAVDNEPEPFWTGDDQWERIDAWREAVDFRDDWGRVEPCGNLNGPSGAWVKERLLDVVGVARDEAWITDCLDTYYQSEGARRRLESEHIAHLVTLLGIPTAQHEPHPSEDDIVRIALSGHRDRLLSELRIAQPQTVVTLGNAALRVLRDLIDEADALPAKLSVEGYGEPLRVSLASRDVEWVPLAHPAAPAVYQAAHDQWIARQAASA